MSSMFTSLLPFLAALKRQPSVPQDDDDSNAPEQFEGAEPVGGPSQNNTQSMAQQGMAQQTKGDLLAQILQSGLQGSDPNRARTNVVPPMRDAGEAENASSSTAAGVSPSDPNQTGTILDQLTRGIGGPVNATAASPAGGPAPQPSAAAQIPGKQGSPSSGAQRARQVGKQNAPAAASRGVGQSDPSQMDPGQQHVFEETGIYPDQRMAVATANQLAQYANSGAPPPPGSVQKLLQVQEQARGMDEFQPDEDGPTHCNKAVTWQVQQMGGDTTPLLGPQGEAIKANTQVRNLLKPGSGYDEVTLEKAQEYTNRTGMPALAGSINTDKGKDGKEKSGHIATLVPQQIPQGQSGAQPTQVNHIGNSVKVTSVNGAFYNPKDPRYKPVRYFIASQR
jgi:hypothetical protein